ncbi:MAG: tetratricopeptide repeat protein [Deltaproteobacteria bacterium]|nr:tetratricopeptide repeat protein [Deltaproteobacteria bacterium]
MRSQIPILVFTLAFVPLSIAIATNRGFCLTSQDVPSAELPGPNAAPSDAGTAAPTPAAASSPSKSDSPPSENYSTPETSSNAASQQNPASENPSPNDAGSADERTDGAIENLGTESAPQPNAPPPALDASALAIAPQLGDQSLAREINKAVAPTLVASLRLTEKARKQLGNGQIDDTLRDLGRAVSLDPSNAFAYYYLGRAYLARKNYGQAQTFFRRAVIGFRGRPDWTAEALSYEGVCDEELDKSADAQQAYKQALALSPNNFRARVGYGRLAGLAGPVENGDGTPNQNLAIPPPNVPEEAAPPEQPPAAPPG